MFKILLRAYKRVFTNEWTKHLNIQTIRKHEATLKCKTPASLFKINPTTSVKIVARKLWQSHYYHVINLLLNFHIWFKMLKNMNSIRHFVISWQLSFSGFRNMDNSNSPITREPFPFDENNCTRLITIFEQLSIKRKFADILKCLAIFSEF